MELRIKNGERGIECQQIIISTFQIHYSKFMQTCLITGASDGIGFITARELARAGMRVVMAGRNRAKTAAAARLVREQTGSADVEYLLADLSSQDEVRRLAGEFRERSDRLDVLVNNAGAFFLYRRESADGIEMTFALNHLGYFLLTGLLLDLLLASAPARIVNISSSSHRQAGTLRLDELRDPPGRHRGYRAYARSKLCNILFTYELAQRLEGSGVTANALHPGLVRTNIMVNNGILGRIGNFFISARGVTAEKGAETPVHLAASPEMEGVTGKYFVNKRETESSPQSYYRPLAAGLWELSERLTGLEFPLQG